MMSARFPQLEVLLFFVNWSSLMTFIFKLLHWLSSQRKVSGYFPHYFALLCRRPYSNLIIIGFQLLSRWIMTTCGASPVKPGFWTATWKCNEPPGPTLLRSPRPGLHVAREHAHSSFSLTCDDTSVAETHNFWTCSPIVLGQRRSSPLPSGKITPTSRDIIWPWRHRRSSSLFPAPLRLDRCIDGHIVGMTAGPFFPPLISQEERRALSYAIMILVERLIMATNRWHPDDDLGPARFWFSLKSRPCYSNKSKATAEPSGP